MATCINVSVCVSLWMGGASEGSVHRGKRPVRDNGQEQGTREWMLSRGWELYGDQKKSESSREAQGRVEAGGGGNISFWIAGSFWC